MAWMVNTALVNYRKMSAAQTREKGRFCCKNQRERGSSLIVTLREKLTAGLAETRLAHVLSRPERRTATKDSSLS